MNIKISKGHIGFILALLLIFLGAINPVLTYISLFGSVVISAYLGTYYAKHPNYQCCVGIMQLLVFQNFCIGVGAHLTNNFSNTLSLLTQVPFLNIFVIWIIIVIKQGHDQLSKSNKYFVFYILMITLSLIVGRGNLNSILINIRNMTCFYMAFEIGRYNIVSTKQLSYYQRDIIKLSIFVLLIGIILLTYGFPLYRAIGIEEVYFAKGSPIHGRLDGRFTTTLVKHQFNRMGSLYYEPVNLGYYFGAVLLGTLFVKWTKNKLKKFFATLIAAVGLLLTFGKGAILLVALAILCVIFARLTRALIGKYGKNKGRNIVIFIAVIVGTVFSIYYYRNVGAAASPHFWGIIQTWRSITKRPYGYGLGTGGNMSQLFNNGENSIDFSEGGETALMSFMYQFGIQGGIALFLVAASLRIKNRNFLRLNRNYEVFYFLPFLILGISLLQDNTFTPQCVVPFMLMQGAVYRLSENWSK